MRVVWFVCSVRLPAAAAGLRNLQISVVDFVAGARSARGITVVIDVFRAFSVAAHAFSRGVATMIPLASIDDARELKRQHPDWLLVGEREGKMLPGFDCGNSPTDLTEKFDLTGRTVIHTTHAGTQGLTQAPLADEVLTGALVNAGAIVRYIQSRKPAVVTIVRMGKHAIENSAEDDLCAELLRSRLAGTPMPVEGIREELRKAPAAKKFFNPEAYWAPEGDFDRCTAVDAFDFVLQLDRNASPPSLRRIDVPR